MRLEIGGPPNPVPGYEQLEERYKWGYHHFPYDDGSVDEVYASHVIEHIPWFLTEKALKEAYRILKPGGVIEIHTVDFDYLVHCYQEQVAGDKWKARGMNPGLDPMKWVASRIFSVGPCDNWHRAIFTWPQLGALMEDAGFKDITPAGEPKASNHGPINLGIKGVK